MAEPAHRKRSSGEGRSKLVTTTANIIRWAGLLISVTLAAHVLLTMGEANPANAITEFLREWADRFVLAFKDLFTPEDGKLRVLINYGLAAIAWLAVSALVTRLIRRLG
jgi:hypothetical protein